MNTSNDEEMKSKTIKFCFGVFVVVSYLGIVLFEYWQVSDIKMEHYGQLGDSMAFLALIVLSATFYYQTKEFNQQTEAFNNQADAMGSQADAMKLQTSATRAQSEAIEKQTHAQALVGIVANTEGFIESIERLKELYGELMEKDKEDRGRFEDVIRDTGPSESLEIALRNISEGYERASELRTQCFLDIERLQKNRTSAFEQLEKLVMEK